MVLRFGTAAVSAVRHVGDVGIVNGDGLLMVNIELPACIGNAMINIDAKQFCLQAVVAVIVAVVLVRRRQRQVSGSTSGTLSLIYDHMPIDDESPFIIDTLRN